MRSVDKADSGSLGKKVEAPAAAKPEAEWKTIPGRPGYETNGQSVRLKTPNGTIYDWYGIPTPTVYYW